MTTWKSLQRQVVIASTVALAHDDAPHLRLAKRLLRYRRLSRTERKDRPCQRCEEDASDV